MKIVISVLLFSVISLQSFAQDKASLTNHLRMEGWIFGKNKDHKSAKLAYQNLINNGYATPLDYLVLSRHSLLTFDTVSFQQNLIKSIEMGCSEDLITKRYKRASKEDKEYLKTQLSKEYKVSRKKYELNYDMDLLEYSKKILELDQMVRKNWKKDTNTTIKIKLGRAIDSLTYIRVVKLIEDGKYPNYSNVGQFADDMTPVLMHITDEDEKKWNYIFNFLKKEVKRGQMTPSRVALIAERHYAHNFKGSKYDKPCSYYGFLIQVYNYDLCNCNQINEMRKAVHLETIQEEYQRVKRELPNCLK